MEFFSNGARRVTAMPRGAPILQNHSCLKASARGELAPFHQGVPYFRQQLNLAGRRRLARRILLLLAAELVHGFDRHEQHEGDDDEGDHIVSEEADIHGRGAGLPRRGE